MPEQKEYMSLEEIAELLGVNYQLVYKLVRSGEMVSARIGRVYRVSKSDFEAYIERSKQPAPEVSCSLCGTVYHSRLSLKHKCMECGEAICVDCWSRKNERYCRAHGQNATTQPAEPLESSRKE